MNALRLCPSIILYLMFVRGSMSSVCQCTHWDQPLPISPSPSGLSCLGYCPSLSNHLLQHQPPPPQQVSLPPPLLEGTMARSSHLRLNHPAENALFFLYLSWKSVNLAAHIAHIKKKNKNKERWWRYMHDLSPSDISATLKSSHHFC